MAPSKSARILKRTAVGGTLVLVLAVLLWLTNRSSDGWPVFAAGGLVLLGAIFEMSRMGSYREHRLLPVMLAASAGVLVLVHDAMSPHWFDHGRFRYENLPEGLVRFHGSTLRLMYAWTVAIAAAAFGLHLSLRAWPRLGNSLPRALTYAVVAAILYFVAQDTVGRVNIGFVAFLGLAVCAVPLMALRSGFRPLCAAVLIAVWIVPPLPLLWAFWREWGTESLIALLVLSKIGDTFGYYVGNAFGKSHPFPRISPGKTTAGCVGSFLGATATGGVLGALDLMHDSYTQTVLGGAIGGAIINLAAQAGDLLESSVKRRAGVKDSSTVFGPSGGVLDQIDSLLLTVPVAMYIWPGPVGAG